MANIYRLGCVECVWIKPPEGGFIVHYIRLEFVSDTNLGVIAINIRRRSNTLISIV